MSYNAGFVGLIGLPNAGKSSLLNQFVEEKVSIVTAKPQTTRRRVLGVVSDDRGQIVFVDAPGVIESAEGLNHFLELEAKDVIQGSDFLLAIISLDTKTKEEAEKIIGLVAASQKPWALIINKMDLIEFARRQEAIKDIASKHKNLVGVFEYSTQWQQDAKQIRKDIFDLCLKNLPASPAPLYEADLFTPHSERDLVTEIIREACFEELHQEIPYNVAIRILKYDESGSKVTKIYAEILVSKENHKAIVIGKAGAVIKQIGVKARKEIEKLLDKQVFLDLNVNVKEAWFENKRMMKELGYVVDDE